LQYGRFAAYYDAMMHDVDRESWADYIDGFLKEANAHTVLDCACGTGAMTIALQKRGYHMIGNDASPDMLMNARNQAFAAGAKEIIFICEDMRKLKIHKPVDALISVCDGVNYLTSLQDAASFFRCAADCLKPNGLLLFDISSNYKLRSILGNNTFTEETDTYAYIWKNAYDQRTKLCEMDLTCFVKVGDHYDRFQETHIQRAHSVAELTNLLEEAGFTGIYAMHAFSREPAHGNSERIQFIARKAE
jgi:SAM-dependent methyltransferase